MRAITCAMLCLAFLSSGCKSCVQSWADEALNDAAVAEIKVIPDASAIATSEPPKPAPTPVPVPTKPVENCLRVLEHHVWGYYKTRVRLAEDFEDSLVRREKAFLADTEKKKQKIRLQADATQWTQALLASELEKQDGTVAEFEEKLTKQRELRSLRGEELSIAQLMNYREDICIAASHLGIHPAVIGAVALTESDGVPRDSADGGRGLMQITGAVVECAKTKVREALHLGTDVELDYVNDNFMNVMVGSAILRCYTDEQEQNLVFGLLAYNSAQNRERIRTARNDYGAQSIEEIMGYINVECAESDPPACLMRREKIKTYPIRVLAHVLSLTLAFPDGMCGSSEVKLRRLPPYFGKENVKRVQAVSVPGLNTEWKFQPADPERYVPPVLNAEAPCRTVHEVQPSDTPSLLALWYYTTMPHLSELNLAKSAKGLTGEKVLIVPATTIKFRHDVNELAKASYPHLPRETAVKYFLRMNGGHVAVNKFVRVPCTNSFVEPKTVSEYEAQRQLGKVPKDVPLKKRK